MRLRFAAKPRHLSFGIVAMALLGFGDGDFFADVFEQNGKRLSVSERVQRFDRP